MISDKFSDYLLAATQLDNIHGLKPNDGEPGPRSFENVNLGAVAKAVFVQGNQTAKADQARPTVLANISSLTMSAQYYMQLSGAKMTAAELAKPGYQDYLEWQGLAAALALHNIYSVKGLELSIKRVQLTAATPVGFSILISMAKDECYRDAVNYDADGKPTDGELFYICQKGIPFAIFHPEIGICPKKDYNRSIFAGVLDWYDPEDGWKNLLDANTPQSILLEDFHLGRFAWWLKENGLTQAFDKCKRRMQGPYNHTQYNALKGTPLRGAAQIDEIAQKRQLVRNTTAQTARIMWTDKGSKMLTGVMAYSYQGEMLPLPNLFTDKLFIADTQNAPSKLIYNVVQGNTVQERRMAFPVQQRDEYTALNAFSPVAPFTPSGAGVLATQCRLSNLEFVPKTDLDSLKWVDVNATVITPNGETVTIQRRYSHENILQGRLPYLMVWPCVPLPANTWQKYYATWAKPEYEKQPRLKRPATQEEQQENTVELNCCDEARMHIKMNAGCPNEVNRAIATAEEKWTVCCHTEQFEYAELLYQTDPDREERETLGVVFVPYRRPIQPTDTAAQNGLAATLVNTPVNLAVDFGTTSTVVALQHPMLEGGKTLPLRYNDKEYGCTLTVEDQKAREKVIRHRWLGKEEHNRKIFSVAQLLTRAEGITGPKENVIADAGKREYYVDGRMLIISSQLLQAYTNGTDVNALRNQRIINDMKFSAQGNSINTHAAAVFLAGIYQYAVLELLSRGFIPVPGVKYLELYASYPNKITLGSLKKSWEYVEQILQGTMSSQLLFPLHYDSIKKIEQIHYHTEASATTAYNSRAEVVKHIPHMISVDIGGGTTDISLMNTDYDAKDGKARQLSVRYAGREIMTESLIQCYCRYTKEDGDEGDTIQAGKENDFEELWLADGCDELIKGFHAACRASNQTPIQRKALTRNASMRQRIECLLDEGMDIGDPDRKPQQKTLRQVITLKFALLLTVVAEFVARNMDIWEDQNGKLKIEDNVLGLGMVVSGTSAQLLQYVFNCKLSDLDDKNKNEADLPQVQEGIDLVNQFIEDAIKDVIGEEKWGENQVSVRFHVNPDVADKCEVCFGLVEIAKNGKLAADSQPKTKADVPNVSAQRGRHRRGRDRQAADTDTVTASSKSPAEQQQQAGEMRAQRAVQVMNDVSYSKLQEFVSDFLGYTTNKFEEKVANYSTDMDPPVLSMNGAPVINLLSMLGALQPQDFAAIRQEAQAEWGEFMAAEEMTPYLETMAKIYLTEELLRTQIAKYQQ